MKLFVLSCVGVLTVFGQLPAETIDLSGSWQVRLDESSIGGAPNVRIELRGRGPNSFDDLQLFPDSDKRILTVKYSLTGQPLGSSDLTATWEIESLDKTEVKTGKFDLLAGNRGEFVVPLDSSFQPWDEFHPNLYRFHLILATKTNGQIQDERALAFRIRKICTTNSQFLVNGETCPPGHLPSETW